MITFSEHSCLPNSKQPLKDFEPLLMVFLAANYRQNVADFIKSCHEIGANMTVKLHFLHNHLDDFPDNLGDFSEQHGEKFHRSIS